MWTKWDPIEYYFYFTLIYVLSWPEDGRLRPKHVDKYNPVVIIASYLMYIVYWRCVIYYTEYRVAHCLVWIKYSAAVVSKFTTAFTLQSKPSQNTNISTLPFLHCRSVILTDYLFFPIYLSFYDATQLPVNVKEWNISTSLKGFVMKQMTALQRVETFRFSSRNRTLGICFAQWCDVSDMCKPP